MIRQKCLKFKAKANNRPKKKDVRNFIQSSSEASCFVNNPVWSEIYYDINSVFEIYRILIILKKRNWIAKKYGIRKLYFVAKTQLLLI